MKSIALALFLFSFFLLFRGGVTFFSYNFQKPRNQTIELANLLICLYMYMKAVKIYNMIQD